MPKTSQRTGAFTESMIRRMTRLSTAHQAVNLARISIRRSTEAMIVAMMTACNPSDKVVIFSLFYENYVADSILSGAVPIYVPLRPPDFSFDPAELRRAFEQRPKALILCNPSNPFGQGVHARGVALYRLACGGVRYLREAAADNPYAACC